MPDKASNWPSLRRTHVLFIFTSGQRGSHEGVLSSFRVVDKSLKCSRRTSVNNRRSSILAMKNFSIYLLEWLKINNYNFGGGAI